MSMIIEDTIPTSTPITSSHIRPDQWVGLIQLIQMPPGVLELLSAARIWTDLLLDAEGLSPSAAVKTIVKFWPAWLVVGVKENTPVEASKLMPETRPDADTVMVSPGKTGSFAVTVKLRVFPTVTVWAPGTLIVGIRGGSTTVTITVPLAEREPSVTVKPTV